MIEYIENADPRAGIIEPYETQWFGTDTEVRHRSNVHNQVDMKANGWQEAEPFVYYYNPEKPIKTDTVDLVYRINKHGFRGDPLPLFETPRSIITLGDATTFGVGMPEGITWTSHVSNSLKYRGINLGMPGASIDTCFRVLLAWLPRLKSKYVFMLEPMTPSTENIFSQPSFEGLPSNQISTDWLMHKEKTMRAMQNVCDQFNSRLVILQHTQWAEDENQIIFNSQGERDKARDLHSPGRKCHIYITYRMLKMINFKWDIEIAMKGSEHELD